MNNMKQLGLGVLNYVGSVGKYPAAMTVPKTADAANTNQWGANWVITILPQIEDTGLSKQFHIDFGKGLYVSSGTNEIARKTNLPVMLCPSDSKNMILYNPGPSSSGDGANWARGNYAAQSNVMQLNVWNTPSGDSSSNDAQGGGSVNQKTAWVRGVMGCNFGLTPQQITDGAAFTFMLLETRSGFISIDRRGTWAMGACGASSFWGDGTTDDQGPDNQTVEADDMKECGDIVAAFKGNADALAAASHMGGCCDPGGSGCGNKQSTPRSVHPGGVHACFCDGHVYFISDYIDSTGVAAGGTPPWGFTSPTALPVWERLCAAGDSQPIDQNKF